MALTPFGERLSLEITLPVLTTLVGPGQDSDTQPSAREANALTDCATAAILSVKEGSLCTLQLT